MAAIVLTAVFADLLATHDPVATDAAQTLARPSAEHWLGTDNLGRDIYSRIVHGARVSLIVGLASTLLGSVLGGRHRAPVRLRRRPDRPRDPAGARHPPGAAAPGAGARHVGRARARRSRTS